MNDIPNNGCYSFFLIKSAGILDYDKGFIPENNSSFYPETITDLLKIQPFKTIRIGDKRSGKDDVYNFSAWYGCKQTEPQADRIEQCEMIVKLLKPHISTLNKIKEMYNVSFSIEIYPLSENVGGVIGISKDVIEFCYLTGTEILVDMFCYSTES